MAVGEKNKIRKSMVAVAMSGGVDSSAAAALLKKKGFEVFGIFMKLWLEGSAKEENKCCSSESEERARAVCDVLGIPFYVLNLEKEFKKMVVDCFIDEYESGNTPNPCIICNKQIKFGLLMEKAIAMGADYFATGHYAKKIKSKSGNSSHVHKLLQAKDVSKDQSYFLWTFNQTQLERVLFPIGDYEKTKIRKIARELGLPNFNAPESQEICFVNKDANDFLKRYAVKTKQGKIISPTGEILGIHKGLIFYTIGQRKGIGLSGGPYFVVNKDIKNNVLIVTNKKKDLFRNNLRARNTNWISGIEPNLPLSIGLKIRNRSKKVSAVVSKRLGKQIYFLELKKSQSGITPGQSAVFYRGNEMLGGGIIFG